MHTRSCVALAVGYTVLSLAAQGHAAPQTKAQQACVGALNRAGVAVARAQAKLTSTCLGGDDAAVAACVGNAADPGLAAALQATFDAAVAACEDIADFGVAPTVDQGVNEAAVAHVRGLFADALGSSPGEALIDRGVDRRGRRCQTAVIRGAGSLVTGFLKAFDRCVRTLLARGGEDEVGISTCVAVARRRVGKARGRLISSASRRCRRTSADTAFPGVCASRGIAQPGHCMAARALCRACKAANAMDMLAVDCDALDDGLDNGSCTLHVTLSGDAIPFIGSPTGRIAGADVSVLELPDRHVTTGVDGRFVFDGLEEGSDVTVVMRHPEYHPIQTGTFRLGPNGIDRVTFQAVTPLIYDALASLLGVVPDEANRCQMVTTVTRVGRSIYDPGAHGEDRVTVTLDPPLPAEHGPIYFNSSVLPDRALTETSDDGGVLFIQVPPGAYVWTARKPGAVFSRVRMTCRPGYLVNASPPRGLQRH
jgi:hypothetical protein